MTQVAGLQTVDAEGNVIGTLSVDDLTELVANNLVKSTQNQIAVARSVSTMSEASTLAASDDYENTLPIDANPASVRTLDSEGNPKRTAISALAQVVGVLLDSSKLYPFMYRGICTDFNKATEAGYYHVYSTSEIPNQPNGAYSYGTLLVFGTVYTIQIYYPETYGKMYKRNLIETVWKQWYEFNGTQAV